MIEIYLLLIILTPVKIRRATITRDVSMNKVVLFCAGGKAEVADLATGCDTASGTAVGASVGMGPNCRSD